MRSAPVLRVLTLLALAVPAAVRAQQRFDILITGGRVLDGTGNPWIRADVGIRGERIAAIGELRGAGATADRTIDAGGRLVTPGFIALHEHIDRGILRGQSLVPNYLTQGFTTAVINADGLEGGIWPLRTQRDSLERLGHGLNLVPMVSHGTVRRLVMGTSPAEVMRPAGPEELTRMQALVRQGMEEGGFGLSTGLEYNPMRYSTTEELVALARVVAEFGGHVQMHMRSQGRYPKWQLPSHMDHPTQRHVDWMDAINEGIEIARKAGVPVWFDHIHPKGPREWGVSKPTVETIQRAWDQGLQIYTNMHSYEGYAETVTLVPRWALAKREVPGMSMSDDFPPVDYTGAGENMERNLADAARRAMMEQDALYEIERQGGADGLVINGFPDRAMVGKSLGQVAREKGMSLFETALWLVRNGFPDRLGGVVWTMKAVGMVDIEEWMRHDWNGVSLDRGVDDLASCRQFTHPGTWGTSGRLLQVFVRERKTITLPYAIRSLTSVGAQALGLSDRGQLREGMMADVVVLDPEAIRSEATYLNPCVEQKGISHVLVNGVMVVADGKVTGERPGRVLRRR
ncbi:MAG TPA: amidohydrolase family protein [Gemmatimonadales bacterium]|nr:amidohydrolase family protein [Gemmatimonadales bacterium]